jgi:hypothetical protein
MGGEINGGRYQWTMISIDDDTNGRRNGMSEEIYGRKDE